MKTDESLIETIVNSEIVRPYVTLYMEGKTDRKGKRKGKKTRCGQHSATQ